MWVSVDNPVGIVNGNAHQRSLPKPQDLFREVASCPGQGVVGGSIIPGYRLIDALFQNHRDAITITNTMMKAIG